MVWMVLLFLSPRALAITPEEVLKTAWRDKTFLSYDQIQRTDSRNPLRNVEGFISQEYDDDKVEDKFGLKFQFKSWPEWKMGRSEGAEGKLLRSTSLGWALKTRYNTLLLYELNRRKSETLQEMIRLAERHAEALTLSLRAGQSTSKSFRSAKADLLKMKRSLSLLEQERKTLETKMQVWVPGWKDGDLEKTNLISIEDIEQKLKTTTAKTDSLSKKIAIEEIEQLNQELAVVRGKETQWFKEIEVSQARKEGHTSYEIELTVQLPLLFSDDSAKQKQNDLILKRALRQKDVEEAGNQLEILRVQILNLIEIYKDTQKLNKLVGGGLDPLANIERKIITQQENLDLLNQQQEILSLYLDYLLESETLNNAPEKNYLDRSLKALL